MIDTLAMYVAQCLVIKYTNNSSCDVVEIFLYILFRFRPTKLVYLLRVFIEVYLFQASRLDGYVMGFDCQILELFRECGNFWWSFCSMQIS